MVKRYKYIENAVRELNSQRKIYAVRGGARNDNAARNTIYMLSSYTQFSFGISVIYSDYIQLNMHIGPHELLNSPTERHIVLLKLLVLKSVVYLLMPNFWPIVTKC